STSTRTPRSGWRPAKRNASTCARPWLGRRRKSRTRRPGSYPWVGLPIRTWRYLRRRQIDHALQEFADHREMVTLTGILMHQVGQIGVGDVEALRQQAGDQQRHRRLLAQERRGVVELVDDGVGGGAHGRGMRLIEQYRHFAQHRSGL